MRFRIDRELLDRFPELCIGLVLARNVDNASARQTVTDLLRAAEDDARSRLHGVDLRTLTAFDRWHATFSELGMSPSRFKISVEALTARVLKGAPLPDLNPCVDLVNAISLQYSLPIGAHDLASVSGDMVVGPAPAGSVFVPMGGTEPEQVEEGEIVYRDAAEVRTRRWVWRQSEHSKVTAVTHNVLFPIDGWLGVNDDDVRRAQADLAAHLQAEIGAETQLFFLDREHAEVDLMPADQTSEPAVALPVGLQAEGQTPEAASGTPGVGDGLDVPADVAALPAGGRRWGKQDAISRLLNRATEQVVVREELEARLRRGDMLRVKFGVDPTSPYLHLGHAVVLRKLRAFQELGHTICLVIGDFTAQIGDASDKMSMRQMLSEQEVYENLASYKKQISRILDESAVEWSYNADWLGPLRFKDVVGLAANFTVAQILERENFSKRYESGQSIGLQEFLYPLMQGYDSVALHSDVEVGGTEQLFNLIAGRTLQRAFDQPPQAVMTCSLLLGLDGRKMSKSYGNSIALEDSAKDMFGKVMAFPDQQILPGFELCTEVPLEEIDAIADDIAAGRNPMNLKKRLAYEVTRLYHTPAQALAAQEAFEREVQRKERPSELAQVVLDRGGVWPLADLLVTAGLVRSKSEARRKAQEGAVFIDDQRVADPQQQIEVRDAMVVKLGRHYRQLQLPV